MPIKIPQKKIFMNGEKGSNILWYQILLLQDTWPEFFETMEAEIHLLADFLGDDHDLSVLKDKIDEDHFHLKDDRHKELINAITNEYSNFLRSNARIKGELIYAEEPEDFINRIGSYT